MNEIVFILDACALSRRLFNDIGSKNLNEIFNIKNATIYIPEIAVIETISALLSAYNSSHINYNDYLSAKSVLFNMIRNNIIYIISLPVEYVKKSILILEEYKIFPGKSFNGIDSIYILTCRTIVKTLEGTNKKVIFVTSDNKLYNASKDETSYKSFHFWTCDLGCKHIEFIPDKGKKDKPEKVIKCNNCNNNIILEKKFTTNNTCTVCNNHCIECNLLNCISTYIPNFNI